MSEIPQKKETLAEASGWISIAVPYIFQHYLLSIINHGSIQAFSFHSDKKDKSLLYYSLLGSTVHYRR